MVGTTEKLVSFIKENDCLMETGIIGTVSSSLHLSCAFWYDDVTTMVG
jgi:hypothetical protein